MGRRASTLTGYLPKKALVMTRKKSATAKNAQKPASETKLLKTSPVETPARDSWQKLSADLEGCMRCRLGKTRTNIVFADGNPKAELMFVGEAPGEQEDLQGKPFVGRAGQLLDKMIQAMGLTRNDVYIANIVKCRPPDNRFPEPDEVSTCSPFLARQIALIRPKVIVALGKCASHSLLKVETPIGKLRGEFIPFQGTELMPTFHPSYLLRNPSAKKEVWEDLQKVAKHLGIKIPPQRQRFDASPSA
jgi:uracil-DNA glycosylase family 4